MLNAWGSHARLGQGEYLVAEADESDGSFLLLQPVVALVTNIDRDHLDAYNNSFEALRSAFLEFLHHLPFYGIAVLCIDDPYCRELAAANSRATVTYGFADDADIRASEVKQQGRNTTFRVHLPEGQDSVAVELNLPGRHNVLNALGAIAVAWELGVDIGAVVPVLTEFKGVGRRFAEVGEFDIAQGQVLIIEDYGHHPSELEATLIAAREGWPERRIVMVFQPHRYTRTRDLFDDFTDVLSNADHLVLTDIYAAGEPEIDGIDSRALCQAIRARGRVDPVLVHEVDRLEQALSSMLQDGDLVLLMGAGDIGQVAENIRQHGLAIGGVA